YAFILIIIPLLLVAIFTSVFFTVFINSMVVFLIFTLYNARVFIPLVKPVFDPLLLIYISTVVVFILPFLLAVFMNILKKTQYDLSKSEALFRSAVINSGVGMALISKKGELFLVNDALCKMLQYTQDELMHTTIQDIIHSADKAAMIHLLKKIERGDVDSLNCKKRYLSKHGKIIWIHLYLTTVADPQGLLKYYVGHFQDITHAHDLERSLEYNASHDDLTGLYNRRKFEKYLIHVVNHHKQYDSPAILCYMDLDFFKIVNDTAGHMAGDLLLQNVATLLQHHIDKTDIIARLGGDEFGLLLLNSSLAQAKTLCQTIIEDIAAIRFTWDKKIFRIGMSIGIVPLLGAHRNSSQLLSDADIACYAAKAEGRNQIFVFEEKQAKSLAYSHQILFANTIQEAMEHGRLHLFVQKIQSIQPDDPHVNFFEVLIRLQNEEQKLFDAKSFITIAERFNYMATIDRWVLSQLLEHHDLELSRYPDIHFSINLSANSLNHPDFLDFLLKLLKKSSIAPYRLCFEITETALINNIDNAIILIHELQKLGCQISLDDFGTGLSSFNYFKNFSADMIKIDGSFIKNISKKSRDYSIIKTINDMAHHFGIKTVAECVEDEEMMNEVRHLGIDYAQGYFIGRPFALNDLLK
ncbi:MAG TPA: EAL domain-containing protein, partial [Legionellaceae bacterium]|nr:EAL domain-containing protein [Legionellaceae bacterium]